MAAVVDELAQVIQDSLRFEWLDGGCVPITTAHAIGWRTLPMAVTVQATGGRARCELADGRRYRFAAICVPAGVRHRMAVEPGEALVSRWSHVHFRILGGVDVLDADIGAIELRGDVADALGDLNERLATLAAAPRATAIAHAVERAALGLRMLAILLAAHSAPVFHGHRLAAMRRVAPALAAIDAHLGDPTLDLVALAGAARMSPSRLHAAFTRAVGVPPVRYLLARRRARAQELLAATGLGIGEISDRVGYGDVFHFSRAFKRAFGISPSGYRTRAREARF